MTRAGVGRSFQITNLFGGLTVEENVRLAVQARHRKHFAWWASAEGIDEVNAETAAFMSWLGLTGIERAEAASLSYGGQRLLDMGLALATAPHILLLDEPLAGLAAAERTRVAALVKSISRQIPVLLVEHDIDRVFQIADVVTVMNEGAVLVHGSVEEARGNAKVREIYIGSGTAHVTAEAPPSAAGATTLLSVDKVDTFYGKSHILNAVSLDVFGARDRRAARPQRRRQVHAAEDADRDRAARDRLDQARRRGDRAASLRAGSRGAASATCRRAGACSPA